MIISQLKLQNWKNFQSIELDLTQRVFVVGPNASGKSNLLDLFRFLRDIVKQGGGLQYAVAQRGGVSKIRCLSARGNSDVSVELALSQELEGPADWIYKLSFKHSGGGIVPHAAKIISEKVWSGEKETWILDRFSEDEGEDSETVKFTHLEQPTSNKGFRDIYHFFRKIEYLHVVPQLVRDADSYFLTAGKEDYYGRNLLNRMENTNERTRKAHLNKINEVLKIAVPQFDELGLKKDRQGTPHLEVRYKHWRPRGAKQEEFQFSDGTLRLIGFMWALLDGTETILLEEPELHLHSELIKRLPEFISKLQRRRKSNIRQVIITTHSYDLLSHSGIGADEVIFLAPRDEGTEAKRVDSAEDCVRYLEAGFSMADAVIPRTAPGNLEKMAQLSLWD